MREFDEVDILDLGLKIMELERKNLKTGKDSDAKMVEKIMKLIEEFTNKRF